MLIVMYKKLSDSELIEQLAILKKKLQTRKQAKDELLASCLRYYDQGRFSVALKQLIETETNIRLTEINMSVLDKYINERDRSQFKIYFYDLAYKRKNFGRIERLTKSEAKADIMKLVSSKKLISEYLDSQNQTFNIENEEYVSVLNGSDLDLHGKPCRSPYAICLYHKCYLTFMNVQHKRCFRKKCVYLVHRGLYFKN